MTTLSEVQGEYRRYLEHERRFAKQTVAAYLGDVRTLMESLGNLDVESIRQADLRAHMRYLSERGYKQRTIERRIYGLSTFFGWLKLEGLIQAGPTEGLRIPRRPRPLPTWLTESELRQFAETPDPNPRNDLAWKLLAWLGMRRGELLALTVADVRLEDGALLIRNSKGNRDRILPLPAALIPALRERTRSVSPEVVLLPGDLGPRWSVSSFNKYFKLHLERCGLAGQGVTPHTLRHSFATHLLEKGVNIVQIQALLGHADIKSTLVYLHTGKKQLQKALELHVLNHPPASR